VANGLNSVAQRRREIDGAHLHPKRGFGESDMRQVGNEPLELLHLALHPFQEGSRSLLVFVSFEEFQRDSQWSQRLAQFMGDSGDEGFFLPMFPSFGPQRRHILHEHENRVRPHGGKRYDRRAVRPSEDLQIERHAFARERLPVILIDEGCALWAKNIADPSSNQRVR
jgi:hypothetical protein